MKDDEFYKLWEEEDKPDNDVEGLALENARLRAQLQDKNQKKVYLVRGDEIFICHKPQIEIKKIKESDGKTYRDIIIKGARMVMYGKNGLRKVDE